MSDCAARPAGDQALLTDLYQLTMLESYHDHGMDDVAVFEFFVRRLPARRSFLLAAGLEQLLDWLEQLRFTEGELAWLRERGFGSGFVDRLAGWRFGGDVDALPEGTVLFAGEPLVRVTAPLAEAQLVETRLINILQFQTLIASKAARCRLAAPGRTLIDFGLRRAHEADAGLLAARAAFLAGFDATATVLAERRFAIPSSGTMAHSFIEAHDSEREAFLHFAESHPGNAVFLIDTYDTRAGARIAAEVARELAPRGVKVRAVRLDSGDLASLAHEVRAILDDSGCTEVAIFASGGLDEYSLGELVAAGAPIDGFGVGTRLDVSADAPSLDCAYKLQEYAGRPRCKRSPGKATWPGRKQVLRRYDSAGRMAGDLVTLVDDAQAPGTPLLAPAMRDGRRVAPSPALGEVRARAVQQLEALPAGLRGPEPAGEPYPVEISPALRRLAREAGCSGD